MKENIEAKIISENISNEAKTMKMKMKTSIMAMAAWRKRHQRKKTM
jgi:hypothetical protein